MNGAKQFCPFIIVLVGRPHSILRSLGDHVCGDLVGVGNFVRCCNVCQAVCKALFNKRCITQFQQPIGELTDIFKHGFLAAHLVKDIFAGELLAECFQCLRTFFHAGSICQNIVLLVLAQLEHFSVLYHIGKRLLITAAPVDAVFDLVPDLFCHVLAGFVDMQGFGLYKIGAFAGLSVKGLQGRADFIRNPRDWHLRHVRCNVADLGARVQQEAQAAGFGQLLG